MQMRRTIAHDSTYYESLSDISMATLGIFIILFVINLIYIQWFSCCLIIRQTKINSMIAMGWMEGELLIYMLIHKSRGQF